VSGPVSIVVTDKLDASGGGFANTTRTPANLQISSSYSGTGGVTLSGRSGSYMSVYPPRTGITLSGGRRSTVPARQDARVGRLLGAPWETRSTRSVSRSVR
jgi:hypothetical protein